MDRLVLRHAPAALLFALFAIGWTYPLVLHLPTHLPGFDAADNVTFLWNFWWVRTALAQGLDQFRTTYLFTPEGTDLTLHTHTALPALVGATMLRPLSIIAAQNVVMLVAVWLNGFCAYLLAHRLTRDRGAAIVAGLIFGGSPYLAGHLNGHFNLMHAWTIPLFAFAISKAMEARLQARSWSLFAGVILGATAYIDYYYVIFAAMLGVILIVLTNRHWALRFDPQLASRKAMRLVASAIALDLALIAAIVATGGFSIPWGGTRLSVQGLFNPLQLLWALVGIWVLVRLQPTVIVSSFEWERRRPPLRYLVAAFLLTAAPILWHAAALVIRGDYVTQRYFWRSAPSGIDLATLVFGNPFHGLWGSAVQRVYRKFDIDLLESNAWLGIVPVVLAILALRRHRSDPEVRRWTVIGTLAFVWALGHHLMAFGVNTAMILPQALLRYIPVLDNARIPGRAMVVVHLVLATLAAIALASPKLAERVAPASPKLAERAKAERAKAGRARSRHSTRVLAIAAVLVVADFLPAPFPLTAIERPGIYDTLRQRPEQGALCELPLGVRDGFGQLGWLDHRVLFYQTIHERPLVGGFVARLPQSVLAYYRSDPLLAGLLRLSAQNQAGDEGPSLPDAAAASDLFRRNGIRFVMLNRATASAPLIDYVEHVLPLTLIAEEGERRLYVLR